MKKKKSIMHGGFRVELRNVTYRIKRADGRIEGPFKVPNLTLNAGRNKARQQLHDTSYATSGKVAQYVAVTANSADPDAGDTTLTGEETANGLARAAATYSSGAGVGEWQLDITYTYTSATPITIAKSMVFDNSTGGNGYYEALLSPVAVLNQTDQLILTWAGTVQAA